MKETLTPIDAVLPSPAFVDSLRRAVLDSSSIAIVAIDLTGTIMFMNKAHEKLLGYSAEECIGRLTPAIWHDEREMAEVAELLGNKLGLTIEPSYDAFVSDLKYYGAQNKEWTFICKDGSRFPGIVSIEPLTALNGDPIGFVGIITDLTSQKEHQKQELERQLYLNAIIDNMVDGLVSIDARGIVREFNPASEAMFGYKSGEVVGRNVSMLMPQNIAASHDAHIERYMKTGESHVIGVGREVMARRKDGSEFAAELALSLAGSDTAPIFVGIIRDRTREARARKEKEALIKKLRESRDELERFAAVASHDLQEPLRSINNFSEKIVGSYADKIDEDGRLFLRLIVDASRRLQTMIADMLEYARAGNMPDMDKEFESADEFVQMLSNLSGTYNDIDERVTSDALPILRGNPVRFGRVLQNLVCNGLKYQPPGVKGRVHIHVSDAGNEWVFAVSDNGIGIAEKNLNYIFEPFRRLHGRNAYEGSGLGLSVCKKIITQSGGRIWCQSEQGKGSTFFFTWVKTPCVTHDSSDSGHE